MQYSYLSASLATLERKFGIKSKADIVIRLWTMFEELLYTVYVKLKILLRTSVAVYNKK
jgi:hypothetical protein